jgi:hypothetical protein
MPASMISAVSKIGDQKGDLKIEGFCLALEAREIPDLNRSATAVR